MAAVATVEAARFRAGAGGSKYVRTDWTEAKLSVLREILPTHGVGRAAVLLCVTEPTIRKKAAELGIEVGRLRKTRARLQGENADTLRDLWAKGAPRRVIAGQLGVSAKTLEYWILKLNLPSRVQQASTGIFRPLFSVDLEAERPNKPTLTKACYYAPECREIIITVAGGPRMCRACQERVARC